MLPRILTLAVLAVLLGVTCTAPLAAQSDWPQFRGPGGLAVSQETALPKVLDLKSPALRWKADIPGNGISSPVVSRDQIFLTTADQSEAAEQARDYTIIGMLVLGGLALLAIAGRLVRRSGRVEMSGFAKLLSRLDVLASFLATMAFAGIAAVAISAPEKLWAPGIPGDTWLVTGTGGMVGLFAAFGWLRPNSIGRVLGSMGLLAAAVYLFAYLPLNKHHLQYTLIYKVVLVAPGIGGALWHALVFAACRRGGTAGNLLGPLATTLVAAVSVLLFVSCNVIMPAVGLTRSVISLDLATGQELWNTSLFVAPEERLHRKSSFATPSACMSADGERIMAFFGPGWACVDRDGAELWGGRDEEYMEQSHYGAVSSPILYEDTFILLHDTERTDYKCSYIKALDVETGDERWKISPEYAHECYMTPLLMPVGGSPQMVTVTFGLVVAYDPTSGEKLWQLELPTWQHVPSLSYEGDVLFVSGGAHEKWITAAVRLTGSGKKTVPEVIWKSTRMVPNSASPVLTGGMLFTITEGGIMVCYDAQTGKRHWKQRLDGSCFASLVAGDGAIYVCLEEGEVVVVKVASEFEELSRTDLGETILATPAISQGNVLIRTAEHLYCFGASD